MIENRTAVPAPASHPFSFALAPEMTPPIKRATKDVTKIIHENEASVKEVNVRIREIMKLKERAIARIDNRPNNIAGNNVRDDVIVFSPLS